MPIEILQGLAIPFLGTTLGAACVFLLRGELDHRIQKAFTGFAAGIMVAASVWSLLIPSMEESSALGAYASLPAVAGFWAGTLFLLLLDHIIPQSIAISVQEAIYHQVDELFDKFCPTKHLDIIRHVITRTDMTLDDIEQLQELLEAKKATAVDEVTCTCIPGQCTCKEHLELEASHG